MKRDGILNKVVIFFKTLKKSNRYVYIESYKKFPEIFAEKYIDRFTNTEIQVDFPTASMLHMNLPKALYKKYGKDNFEKESGSVGYKLKYNPKNILIYITYNNEGRANDNITVKIGRKMTDYVIDNKD